TTREIAIAPQTQLITSTTTPRVAIGHREGWGGAITTREIAIAPQTQLITSTTTPRVAIGHSEG
ncbi:hypothetical protein, partial [Paenibacillus sp. PL2-23]|uniref:hypothetical protein n=1 Tax=Paenibacillus sp. PL2-23 TaxID=2100729 RepID=UPI0030F520BC